MKPLLLPLMATLALSFNSAAHAFEDTQVLPKGVRNFDLRILTTNIAEKTDGSSNPQPLAKPLEKALTFKDVLKSESDPIKRAQSEAVMRLAGFSTSTPLGHFSADLKGRVTVFAPILAVGILDNLTVAMAAPIYNAASTVAVGYNKDQNADRFTQFLQNNHELNLVENGRDAANRLTNAIDELNKKASKNGRQELSEGNGQWKKVSFGDITVLGKYRFYSAPVLSIAATGGLVLPTGPAESPYILTDLPIGDGQWDIFAGSNFDETLYDGPMKVIFNQYGKYTWQLPGERPVALLTPDTTPVDAPIQNTRYALGDKIDAGTALLLQSNDGLNVGFGYNYSRKFKDIYKVADAVTKDLLQADTDTQMHQAEFEIGYTTIPAFQRKEFPVPLQTKISYKQHLSSRNSPVTNFLQLETGLFF